MLVVEGHAAFVAAILICMKGASARARFYLTEVGLDGGYLLTILLAALGRVVVG
jgi:hypothetical protein